MSFIMSASAAINLKMFTWLEIGKIQETEIVFKCCCCLLCGGVFVSLVVFIHTRASLHVRAAKHTQDNLHNKITSLHIQCFIVFLK